MEPTSMAFRVTLPDLDEAQFDKLKRWTEPSCAAGLVLREEKNVILIATRERARTKEAFMRSVRNALGRLGIIVPNARKKRWLVLTSEDGRRGDYGEEQMRRAVDQGAAYKKR